MGEMGNEQEVRQQVKMLLFLAGSKLPQAVAGYSGHNGISSPHGLGGIEPYLRL